MFFNAMRRKGYTPHEEEMDAVVAIHNAVNERAWGEVVAWEATLHPECTAGLKLLRFQGKPDEPTLKARANALLGCSPPFEPARLGGLAVRLGGHLPARLLQWPRNAGQTRRDAHRRAPDATDAQGMWDRVLCHLYNVDGGDRALMGTHAFKLIGTHAFNFCCDPGNTQEFIVNNSPVSLSRTRRKS